MQFEALELHAQQKLEAHLVWDNEGQKTIRGYTDAGDRAELIFQITKVHKALASISRMTEAGNIVHFDERSPGGSYIETPAGKRIPLEKRNRVFGFNMCVDIQASRAACSQGEAQKGFPRPPKA